MRILIGRRPTNRIESSPQELWVWLRQTLSTRKSCERERFTYHNENARGGPMLPPGCCSRFVWATRSTSLLARAKIVACSRGSQQKYCVALSENSWCGSSVCDDYMLFSLAKWLGNVFI